MGGSLRLTSNGSRRALRYGSEYHVPVMVAEVLHYLRPERGGLYLDGTLGGGGHAEAILEASPEGHLIGVDRDAEAISTATERLGRFSGRFRSVRANFAEALEAAGIGEGQLAGALLDLGISSHQVDAQSRGFTFREGAPLDMRMEGMGGGVSAAEILNDWEEEELASLFYRYGEERRSRRLARVLVEMRRETPIEMSDQLVQAIDRSIPRAMAQDRARIFQALRIAVNREMEALEEVLPRLLSGLAENGVLVVISYHSLEDRQVKDAFREWSRECVCPPGLPVCVCRGKRLGVTLTRKPVRPTAEEVEANPRARSARLRAWRKE
jgi:16S rRNA (cytosine1402-N4)-methyltransferase